MRSKWSRDWTKKHKKVGTVRAHKRHVNPATNRKRGSAKRRRFSPAQLAAQRRFAAMARNRAAAARGARRVASNPSPRTGGSMARRKRRRSAAGTTKRRRRRRSVARNPRRAVRRRRRRTLRANPRRTVRRRRRSSYRRNPGVSARGLMNTLIQGAKDGFVVAVGSGVTRFVSAKIPFGQTSAISQGAIKLLTGVLLATIVRKVTRSDRTASFFLAGAMADVVRTVAAPVPVIGPLLAGVGVYPRAPRGVGVYPRALNAWPATDLTAVAPSNGNGSAVRPFADASEDFDTVLM